MKDMFQKDNVEVFTTKVGITVGGLHLEDTFLYLKDRDIECGSTQVVNGNDRVIRTVESIRQSGSGGLVDHTEHVETSNLTGILSGLTLSVVEISRNGDDGMPTLKVNVT